MSLRLALLSTLALAACHPVPRLLPAEGAWQIFSLGAAPPEMAEPGEQRYLIRVPRRYVDPTLLNVPMQLDERGRIVANDVRIAVHYPAMTPAADGREPDIVWFSIGNIVEDGIRRSFNGSWLNYYSGYSVDLPDAVGLHVRRRPERIVDDRLYFRSTPTLDVRIECFSNPARPRAGCHMSAKRPGRPVVDTGFSNRELPSWAARLARLEALFRSDGEGPLAGLHPA